MTVTSDDINNASSIWLASSSSVYNQTFLETVDKKVINKLQNSDALEQGNIKFSLDNSNHFKAAAQNLIAVAHKL